MKKLLTFTLILSLILSLSACGGSEEKKDGDKDVTTTQSQETNTEEKKETATILLPETADGELITTYYYYAEVDSEGEKLYCRLFFAPSTGEACFCDDPTYQLQTAKYTEKDGLVTVTLEDQTWNFNISEDKLTYVAEGSSPLYAAGNVFKGNADKNTTLEDGFTLPLEEVSHLTSGTYTLEEGTALLTIDAAAKTYKLEDEGKVIADSSFVIMADGSCADTKDVAIQFFPSESNTIWGSFSDVYSGNFLFNE